MAIETQNVSLKEEYNSRINHVVNYIYANLDKDLNLETLAGIAHFSPFHFHRIFSSIIGESLNRYIRRKRLEKAAVQLLANPESTITRIAYNCGFNSSASFTRAFRDHYKMSPGKWREDTLKNAINELETVLPEKIDVKNLPDMTVACITHRGLSPDNKKNSAVAMTLFEKLNKWLFQHNIPYTPETKALIIGHDIIGITAFSKLRISACFTIPDDTVTTDGDVRKMIIPGHKYAVGRFIIDQHEYIEAWNYMLQWVPENGHELEYCNSIASLEFYLYVPRNPTDDKHVVELCAPVKPV
jgi:AraC family transcriptional regulator